MQANPKNYTYPPRTTTALPLADAIELYTTMNWTAQLKYNDTRCLIKYYPNGNIELWNRHAEKIRNYHAPEWLLEQLLELPTRLGLETPNQRQFGYHLLDGGLLDSKHVAIKDTIVIWDILIKNGQHQLDTTYNDRYNATFQQFLQGDHEPYYHNNHTLGTMITPSVILPTNLQPKHWQNVWDNLITPINAPYLEKGHGPLIEGLVFKDPTGELEIGYTEKNNSSWMAKTRVTTGRHRF